MDPREIGARKKRGKRGSQKMEEGEKVSRQKAQKRGNVVASTCLGSKR